jgi:hypothetical protein
VTEINLSNLQDALADLRGLRVDGDLTDLGAGLAEACYMMSTHGRDWSRNTNDATLWAVLAGINDDEGNFDPRHLLELAIRFGWSREKTIAVARANMGIRILIQQHGPRAHTPPPANAVTSPADPPGQPTVTPGYHPGTGLPNPRLAAVLQAIPRNE